MYRSGSMHFTVRVSLCSGNRVVGGIRLRCGLQLRKGFRDGQEENVGDRAAVQLVGQTTSGGACRFEKRDRNG